MVNIVRIDGNRYNVDVGFGPFQPMRPIPLQDNYTFTQIPPRLGKLEYRSISQHTDPSQRLWVYSTQDNPSSPWVERNAFVEMEFFRADYEVMNLCAMTAKSGFFVQNVIGMRAILNEDTCQVDGVYTLFGNRLKRQMKMEKAEVLAEWDNENDRVSGIEKYFGVKLSHIERRGITGMPAELEMKRTE